MFSSTAGVLAPPPKLGFVIEVQRVRPEVVSKRTVRLLREPDIVDPNLVTDQPSLDGVITRGPNPLSDAAKAGSVEICRILIEAGVDERMSGFCAIPMATQDGSPNAAVTLIEAGPTPGDLITSWGSRMECCGPPVRRCTSVLMGSLPLAMTIGRGGFAELRGSPLETMAPARVRSRPVRGGCLNRVPVPVESCGAKTGGNRI